MLIPAALVIGAHPLSIEDVEQTARFGRAVQLAAGSRALIGKGGRWCRVTVRWVQVAT
jgi:hypothetical protein